MGSNLVKNAEHPGIKAAREKRAWEARNYRHRHNGLYGAAVMDLAHIRAMMASPSVTPHGKKLAKQIEPLLIQLADELYLYRVELDGTVAKPEH